MEKNCREQFQFGAYYGVRNATINFSEILYCIRKYAYFTINVWIQEYLNAFGVFLVEVANVEVRRHLPRRAAEPEAAGTCAGKRAASHNCIRTVISLTTCGVCTAPHKST